MSKKPNPNLRAQVRAEVVKALAAGKPPKYRQTQTSDIPGFKAFWANRMYELVKIKADLTEDEKAYLVEKLESMRDEKLKSIIVGLMGWGDDERAEVQTYVAVTLELLQRATPSAVKEACRIVEIRSLSAATELPEVYEESKNCVVVSDSDNDTPEMAKVREVFTHYGIQAKTEVIEKIIERLTVPQTANTQQ